MSRGFALVFSIWLSAVTLTAVQAQSLAEAAQQEAARRKEVKGIARVITNKDLPDVRPAAAAPAAQTVVPAAPTAGGAAAAAGTTAAKDDRASKDDAKVQRDEKYWRDRLAAAKNVVAENQVLVDALQSRINALTTDFVNRDDPAQRAVIANDRERAVAELATRKQAIVDGTAAVAEIAEEARRAGVPAGWLR
jgi:hypothetical protein